VSGFVTGTLREAARAIGQAPVLFATLTVVSMLPGLFGLALLGKSDQRVTILVGGLLNLYLQLFATARALDLMGAMPADWRRADATEGRFPSAFLASFLSVLAILLGLALLIVPGIVLMALWGVWMPALLAERLGATEALRRSWRLVRPHPGRVVALLGVSSTGLLLVVSSGVAPVVVWGDTALPAADWAIEPLLALWTIASAVLWAAAYVRLSRIKGGGN
jgi:hypothetical protein